MGVAVGRGDSVGVATVGTSFKIGAPVVCTGCGVVVGSDGKGAIEGLGENVVSIPVLPPLSSGPSSVTVAVGEAVGEKSSGDSPTSPGLSSSSILCFGCSCCCCCDASCRASLLHAH